MSRIHVFIDPADLPSIFSRLDASRDDDRAEEGWQAVKDRIAQSRIPSSET
jgi:hypothetical protein